jgi:carbonic anhydrase
MRRTIAWLVALVTLVALPLAAQEKPLTPETFWEALQVGNKQFVTGKIVYDKLKEERKQFAEHQYPPMTILSCSDSRVPPELIFNQSLGSLFVVRSAGNVADTSIEYAISQGYTSLIVVLGHSNCGAVKASLASDDPGTPSLLALATRIRMSFVGVAWDPNNAEAVKKAVEANTRASAAALLAESRVIRDAVMTGKVKVITAYYDMATGEVRKLD